ncbi:MAG: NADH:flavin oxidoreductase, partial [Sphingomonadales bacterium]
LTPGGLEPADCITIADRLQDESLVDFFDVSLATYVSPDMQVSAMNEPSGYELRWAEPVARSRRVPTFVNGRFNTLREAEDLLASGVADMVSMVRGLIADPELITKSLAGREDEVRPCIGCNQDCIGGVNKPPPRMGCVVNVNAGWELTAQPIGTSERPARVLVAGGGPSGMEAARTAALRGHRVELHEAGDALGGNMRFARRAPYRADIGKIIDFQERELERLGVEVHLNSAVDPALAKARGADHVIVATGAEPRRDGLQRFHLVPVEGADLPHVRSPVDVLGGLADGAKHAVIVDDLGTFQAVTVAEYLLASFLHLNMISFGGGALLRC